MIIEFGHFTLMSAAVVAGLQFCTLFMPQGPRYALMVHQACFLQATLLTLSFGVLSYAFVVSDFSLGIVAANSHTSKPLLYKIAGVWGNHEGSIHLWVLVLSLYGGFLSLQSWASKGNHLLAALSLMGGLNALFLGYLLWMSNPYERISPPPMNGEGFNPILQDPGLAFHPTTLYVGYVGCAVPFVVALGYLLKPYSLELWTVHMRRWVLVPWLFLTTGIVLGSFWAYYELGWGGWWFWDPVENASFMPWLLLTALMHTLIVVNQSGKLVKTSLILALLTYTLSVGGTFIVRSGFISSVHSFAVDPNRATVLLWLITFIVGSSFFIFILKAFKRPSSPVLWLSREGALTLHTFLIGLATFVVFIGTFTPMIALKVFDIPFSLEANYFNTTFLPIMVPTLLLMGLGPWMRWSATDLTVLYPFIVKASLFSAGGVFVVAFYTGLEHLGALAGLFLAFWLGFHALTHWGMRVVKEGVQQVPYIFHGMTLAHFGTAVMVVGMVVSSTWQQEKLLWMTPDTKTSLAGYTFVLRSFDLCRGPNYQGIQANLDVFRGNKKKATLTPERRLYAIEQMTSAEVAIHTTGFADLYATLGQESATGEGYELNIRYNPGVPFIWYGGILLVLGAFISLFSRRGQ